MKEYMACGTFEMDVEYDFVSEAELEVANKNIGESWYKTYNIHAKGIVPIKDLSFKTVVKAESVEVVKPIVLSMLEDSWQFDCNDDFKVLEVRLVSFEVVEVI